MRATFYQVLCLTLLSTPHLLLASSHCPPGATVCVANPLQANSIIGLFQALLSILLIFAVPIIVFFIIYAGFLYVTARGNVETIGRAHKALLYAIIGGLLILGANVLITVIQGTVDAVRSSGS